MKSLRSNSRLLVEQILGENFLDANKTLASLITEAEENREEEVAESLNEDEEAINTDEIDEPTNGSPNLGDSLDQSVEDVDDQSVGEGEMTEMSNDVVEINCEINQKIISKLYDKISNLKTTLTAKDIDHDTREYITLETKLSYYGNKLEELQSKTNPAIDQAKVEERINIIDAALKSLETEIGGSDDVPEVDSTAELDQEDNGSVDDLGDNVGDNVESVEEGEAEVEAEPEEETSEETSDEETEEKPENPEENA